MFGAPASYVDGAGGCGGFRWTSCHDESAGTLPLIQRDLRPQPLQYARPATDSRPRGVSAVFTITDAKYKQLLNYAKRCVSRLV